MPLSVGVRLGRRPGDIPRPAQSINLNQPSDSSRQRPSRPTCCEERGHGVNHQGSGRALDHIKKFDYIARVSLSIFLFLSLPFFFLLLFFSLSLPFSFFVWACNPNFCFIPPHCEHGATPDNWGGGCMPAVLAWLGKGTRVQTQASDGRWYLSKVVGVRARRPRADIQGS